MNTENEKRWFVYIGDHHEGPLSVQDIFERKQNGQVHSESYVWREGMADWLMLSQVQELTQALDSLKPVESGSPGGPPSEPTAESAAPAEDAPAVEIPRPVPLSEKNPASVQKPARGVLVRIVLTIFLLALFTGLLAAAGLSIASRTSDTSLHSRIRPVLERVLEKGPFLRPLFKLVPSLPDVSPQDLPELENARSVAPDTEARIGLALSTADANRPAFYVSTNLPHGMRFDVLLVGQPETLLNRLQYSTQSTLVTSTGFGKSEVFLMEGGQPIPKGEYAVYAYESPEQEESIKTALGSISPSRAQGSTPAEIPATTRFLVSKKYFLGGQKDETYLTRLKAFHESIKEKAEKELTELRQFEQTLILQHASMTGEFQRIFKARKITPAMKSHWRKTSEAWTQISGQLDQAVQTWSPETLQNEFFYGNAYSLIKSAFTGMQALLKAEMEFIEKPEDKGAFEIQHGKLLSETRDSLEQMKAKIKAISSAPKTPGGLPTKEGL